MINDSNGTAESKTGVATILQLRLISFPVSDIKLFLEGRHPMDGRV